MVRHPIISAAFVALGLTILSGMASQPARSAELVMYFSEDCEYSAIFDIEVAPNYPKSAIGRVAPLKRVSVENKGAGGYRLRAPLTVTPTFVLVEKGEELDRITGYAGRADFGKLVGHLVKRHL